MAALIKFNFHSSCLIHLYLVLSRPSCYFFYPRCSNLKHRKYTFFFCPCPRELGFLVMSHQPGNKRDLSWIISAAEWYLSKKHSKTKASKEKRNKRATPQIPISPSKPHAAVHVVTTTASNSLVQKGEGPTKKKLDSWLLPEPSHCPVTERIPACAQRELENHKRK